jgi:hypothetical protein
MSYIPEYHENYYRVEGTAYNQGKIGIGTINPVQLLHVSGGNIRLDGTGYFNGDLNVTGNLNVYGTTAQFAVSQIIAEDKSIELNVQTGNPIGGGNYTTVGFSNDAGADFGGLVIKTTTPADSRGVTDKHLVYRTATPASGWVSNLRFVVSGNYGKDTLQLSDATANVGMTIGTDANNVNLYRSTNDTLKTDDNLIVDLNLNVNGSSTLGDANTDTTIIRGITKIADSSQTNGILFGTSDASYDTNLYRSTTNTLKTDDNLIVDLDLNVNGNTTLGDTNTDATIIRGISKIADSSPSNGILFGSGNASYDTVLYRSAANTLRTDDAFIVSGYFSGIGSGTFSDGSGFITTILNNNPLSVVGSGNSYIQLNIQNRATGTDASADLVITANNGTDNSNFINLGINNSGYSNATFTNGSGFDGYLFINGGDLDIGTQTTGKVIEFHVGGTTIDKTIARINSSGLNMVSGFVLQSLNANVTAGTDGQGQGVASLLLGQVNIITTNAGAGGVGGVTLPPNVSGFSNRIMIRNNAPGNVKVYPNTGHSIDLSGVNFAGALLVQNTQKEFYSAGAKWYSI